LEAIGDFAAFEVSAIIIVGIEYWAIFAILTKILNFFWFREPANFLVVIYGIGTSKIKKIKLLLLLPL
jgi:hypothetical protein